MSKKKKLLSDEITHISVDLLPSNKELGPEEPTPDLIEKIRQHGIIEPIIVSLNDDGETYSVQGGRRRIKSARFLGIENVPARIISLSHDPEVYTLLLHKTRRENPAIEFEAIKQLLQKEYDEVDICTATGMSMQEYRKITSLQRVPEPIIEAVRDGKIKPTIAYQVAKCTPFQIEMLLEKYNHQGNLKGTDVYQVKRVSKQATINTMSGELFTLPPAATIPSPTEENETPLQLLNKIKAHSAKHKDNELNNMLQQLELRIFVEEEL